MHSSRGSTKKSTMSSIRERIGTWAYKHLIDPMYAMTWTEKIVCVIMGFWFGVFPIPGLSTPILFAAMFLINRVVHDPLSPAEYTVATAVNLLATPMLFLMLPLWIYLGQIMLSTEIDCDVAVLISEFKRSGVMKTTADFAQCLFIGTFAWLLYSPLVMCVALIFRGRSLSRSRELA